MVMLAWNKMTNKQREAIIRAAGVRYLVGELRSKKWHEISKPFQEDILKVNWLQTLVEARLIQ